MAPSGPKPFSCNCLLAVILLAFSTKPASAQRQIVDIRQPTLSKALVELGRQSGISLLFDEKMVGKQRAKRVHGRLTVQAALSALLDGTGIGYRATGDGAFALFRLPAHAPPDQSDGAIADILVVGRRTQNADIRRTENDIQHYSVATRREVEDAHSDNLDQFLRTRLPANADILAPTLDVTRMPGAANSRVDLRGLGERRTLILIDGRRLPSIPSGNPSHFQSDVNGVPISAIERIETLTSTAGGIFGPDAIGGVVNIVLRRDYRGVDLSVSSGIAARGDAGRIRVEGRLGFTPDDGTTDVMLLGSYAANQPLTVGERNYETRARQLRFANDPAGYLANPLPSNAIIVTGDSNRALQFDAASGGGNLGGSYTYLPLDFQGTDAQRRATLIANTGKIVLEPGPGYGGRDASLTNTARTISGLANIRHRLSSTVDLFLDGLYIQNHGTYITGYQPFGVFTQADAPGNPFNQPVLFTFPVSDLKALIQRNVNLYRVVAGAIVTLPGQWKVDAELAVGAATYDIHWLTHQLDNSYFSAIALGLPGPGGRVAIAPLDGFQPLRDALVSYAQPARLDAHVVNHYYDASVRVAGPLLRLPGGPMSMTILAEQRREHVPGSIIKQTIFGPDITLTTPEESQKTRSLYAEMRIPLVSAAAGTPLRGLELQIAGRYDTVGTLVPDDIGIFNPTNMRLIRIDRDAATFTVGARFFPVPSIMLRGSFATGAAPPTSDQFASRTITGVSDRGLIDPRRGNRAIVDDGPYVTLMGGSHDIRQTFARTVSIGAVLNANGARPRVSVDYSRISIRDEIIDFPLNNSQLLAAESEYPGRVTRAPLTDDDRRNGYQVGRITQFDTRVANSGRIVVETIDFQFDWSLAPLLGHDIQLYGRATWQPSIRTRLAANRPWIEKIGRYDGALRWRGNAGIAWQRGETALDLNMQYYGGYRLKYSSPDSTMASAQLQLHQGASSIAPQLYLDLAVRQRIYPSGIAPLRSIEVRFGIQNLLDRSPSIIADTESIPYSPYGDPRRRRIELAITSRF